MTPRTAGLMKKSVIIPPELAVRKRYQPFGALKPDTSLENSYACSTG